MTTAPDGDDAKDRARALGGGGRGDGASSMKKTRRGARHAPRRRQARSAEPVCLLLPLGGGAPSRWGRSEPAQRRVPAPACLRLAPEHLGARVALTHVLRQLGDLREALKEGTTASRRPPATATPSRDLVHLARGDDAQRRPPPSSWPRSGFERSRWRFEGSSTGSTRASRPGRAAIYCVQSSKRNSAVPRQGGHRRSPSGNWGYPQTIPGAIPGPELQ